MLQHYRGKQRNYLQWRSQQDINQVGPNYYPPHLRNLRNEWFAKRQEMSKRQEGAAVGERSPGRGWQGTEGYKDVMEKVLKWLQYSSDEEMKEEDSPTKD
jgi:hypothetical protein